jgi:hypothetical protein
MRCSPSGAQDSAFFFGTQRRILLSSAPVRVRKTLVVDSVGEDQLAGEPSGSASLPSAPDHTGVMGLTRAMTSQTLRRVVADEFLGVGLFGEPMGITKLSTLQSVACLGMANRLVAGYLPAECGDVTGAHTRPGRPPLEVLLEVGRVPSPLMCVSRGSRRRHACGKARKPMGIA